MRKILSFLMISLMAISLSAKTLYLAPNDNWKEASARFAVYAFGEGAEWYDMTAVEGEEGLYQTTIDDAYPNVIFCRMDPASIVNNWDYRWHQTQDMVIEADKNLCRISEWVVGSWAVYTPAGAEEDGHAIVLTFTYYNSTSGDSSAKLSTVEAIFDAASQAYVSEVNVGTQVYAGRKYKEGNDSIFSNLKLGSSTAAGELKFTLANPTEVDSIVFRAAMYANNEGGEGFSVNGTAFTLSAGKLKFEDKVWTPEGEVSSIDIVQSKANKGRFFLTSITIYPKAAQGGDEPGDDPEQPVDSMTVYFVNVPAWEAVNAFVWAGENSYKAWPGEAMSKLADQINEKDVYAYTFPASMVNIIFNNGTAQTADLVWEADKPYYYDNAWYALEEIPEQGGDDPVVEPTFPVVAIAGSWDEGWDQHLMVVADDSLTASFTLTLEAANYDFKVVSDGNWLSKYGEAGQFGINRGWNHADHVDVVDGPNFLLEADAAGEYIFTWTYADSTLVVTFPEQEPEQPVDSMTVYFVNVPVWEAVNAYVWENETNAYKQWPGEAMTKLADQINEKDVYAYTFPASFVNIIFNHGENQTTDLVWEADKPYYYDNAWYALEEIPEQGGDDPVVEPTLPVVAIAGSWDELWDQHLMVAADDSLTASFTLTLEAANYDFKVVSDGNWLSKYGEAGQFGINRGWNHADHVDVVDGPNFLLEADAAGEYIFTWTYADSTLVVTFPEQEPEQPVDSMTVYFVNVPAWEAVNAFVWGEATYKAWPGEAMNKLAGQINEKDVYAYTFPASMVNIIFNNGTDQTEDLVWDADKPYYYDNAWYALDEIPAPGDEPEQPVDSMTVYFVNVPAWEAVNAFVWGEATYKAWPGEAMSKLADQINEKDVYAYTFPASYANIIFNNGTAQTEDLVLDADKPYYYDNAWYALNEIPAPGDEPGDEPDVYTVAGSVSILGVDWDVTATANDMTYNEETGIYTLVKENLTLSAFSYPYKVVKNHKWGLGQYPANDDNMILVIAEDGIYNITFTFNPATPELTALAEKVGDAQIEKQYLVVGQSMVANGADWNNDTDINLMTTADEGLTYTLTVSGAELVADATYRYKIVEKGTWNEFFPNIGGADATFSIEADGIYTLTYVYTVATSLCEVQAVKTADLPEARLTDGYYLVGTFSGVDAWTVVDLTEAQRFVLSSTDESGTSYYSLTADLAVDDNIKVVKVIHDEIVLWMPEGEGNNVVVDANHAGEAKNISLEVRANGYWSYNIEPNLYDGYYLVGTMNNWTPVAEYRFSWDETCAEGELALMNVTLTVNDALKVVWVDNGNISVWYPGDGIDNYVVDANHAGETSIYFRTEYFADWAAFGGYFYVIPTGHTDIDNVNAAGEATKILRDGQILIIKGEKMYNVMGQTIK